MHNENELANSQLLGELLKSNTAHLHKLLESNSLLSAIVSPEVTSWQYGCYLTLMQNVLCFYEKDILPLLPIQQRVSTPLITTDLKHLDYAFPPSLIISPFNIEDAEITVPFAWGFGYVMEGSKLGGKVIFKNIQRCLGFSERIGASFISGYGANTSLEWKEWMVQLSHYASHYQCEEEIIKGAEHAFNSLYHYFELNRLVYED